LEILEVLAKGSHEEAVRLLIQGTTRGPFPRGGPLVQWLTEAVGKESATRLVEALAAYPCFYCRHGRQLCEHCGGSGRSGTRGICDRCLGLGQAFCDFCNGSGWAVIDFVPAGLRRAVVLARIRLAMANLKRLLQEPLPAVESGDLQRTGQASVQLLASLNRNMGAIENAVMALKESIPAGPVAQETTAKITEAWARAAPLLDRRMKQVVGLMAEVSRRQGLAAPTEPAREIANQAADFYERVAADSFAFTPLEHPLLRRLKREGG
jgi:hypothetical protein